MLYVSSISRNNSSLLTFFWLSIILFLIHPFLALFLWRHRRLYYEFLKFLRRFPFMFVGAIRRGEWQCIFLLQYNEWKGKYLATKWKTREQRPHRKDKGKRDLLATHGEPDFTWWTHHRRSSREEPVISRQVRRRRRVPPARRSWNKKRGTIKSGPRENDPGGRESWRRSLPWWEVPPYHSNPRIVFLEFRQRDDNKYISRYD